MSNTIVHHNGKVRYLCKCNHAKSQHNYPITNYKRGTECRVPLCSCKEYISDPFTPNYTIEFCETKGLKPCSKEFCKDYENCLFQKEMDAERKSDVEWRRKRGHL